MSVSLVFGRDDPARVRFAISPLWETMAALLAQVRATPAEQVAREVRQSLTQRSGDPVPPAAWRLLDDPPATRTLLAGLLEQCWQLLIAPHWTRLRDLLHADLQYQTRKLGDYGLERVLSELHSLAHWTGHSLLIDAPATERHQLRGAGLLLVPSVFAWPGLVAITEPPARPTLIYPARGIAELWQPAPTIHSRTLGQLLGHTRAALLQSLAEPASTHTLARRHELAPSTVSEHLAILHHAGLITRRRHRHTVLYQQTALGTELARGGQQTQ